MKDNAFQQLYFLKIWRLNYANFVMVKCIRKEGVQNLIVRLAIQQFAMNVARYGHLCIMDAKREDGLRSFRIVWLSYVALTRKIKSIKYLFTE